MLRILTGALACALLSTPALAQGPWTSTDFFEDDGAIDVYGFLRLDTMYDDSRMNDPLIPYLVRSEDPSPPGGVPAGTVAPEDDSEFALSPRLTRVGAHFHSDEAVSGLGSADLSGRLEVDFYNVGLGDSDSRSALRMRLAWAELDWGAWSLRAGQDWDLISPLYPVVNNDLVMWGAGNTGDRRPQVNVRNVTAVGGGELHTGIGIGLTGAVGGSTVVGGLRSGENSGRPMVHARVGYHGKTADGGAFQVGLWAHDAEEEFDAIGAGSTQEYGSDSVGVDVLVPLWKDRVWVKGEYFTGENLRDVRGGILQGVNGATGNEIEAEGGWIELGWKVGERTTLYAGYSFDDPEDADLSNFMAAENSVPYVAARWRSEDLALGLEVLDWETEYVGLESGEALRIVAWIAYYF